MIRHATLTNRLDRIANVLEGKNLKVQAKELDKVANTLEKVALFENLTKEVLKRLPVGKAVSLLISTPGWDEKLPGIMAEIQADLKKDPNIKTAGLLSYIKSPLKMAVLALMLFAGNAQAGGGLETSPKVIEGLAQHMPLPSGFEMAVLKSGVISMDKFESELGDTIMEALDKDSDLNSYIKDHYSGDYSNLRSDLIKAFSLKLQQNPNKARDLVSFINKKDPSSSDKDSALVIVKKMVQDALLDGSLEARLV